MPGGLRQFTQLLVGELLIGTCLVDCFCQEVFGTPVSSQILSNILLSDAREQSEFLSSFIGFRLLLKWRISALLAIALLYPCSVIGVFHQEWLHIGYISRKLRLGFLLLCFVYELPSMGRYAELFISPRNQQRLEDLIIQHYDKAVPTPLHRLVFACYAQWQSHVFLHDIKHSTLAAAVDSCSYSSPRIVLIIGESYNKHHSSLYGYPLFTTPLQQDRQKAGEMYVFNDVVTPWNITSNVMLDVFSVWEYGMSEYIGAMPLVPYLFRQAGYSVNFFSNQYLLNGINSGVFNQMGHFFLSDIELSDSLFNYRNKKSRRYDLELVADYAELKSQEQSPYTLDIIHLVGQHFDYSKRYPHTEAKFHINDYADRHLSDEEKEIVMHYDNAIYYNDIVLDSLLSLNEQSDAVVLFISDHGEEVYDELSLHGRQFQKPTAAQARQEFEVPMWIWCSDSYRCNHPETISLISESVNKPFMTDGIPQILLSLAGISCKWSADESNLLSRHYQCKPRLICGTADYDELLSNAKR